MQWPTWFSSLLMKQDFEHDTNMTQGPYTICISVLKSIFRPSKWNKGKEKEKKWRRKTGNKKMDSSPSHHFSRLFKLSFSFAWFPGISYMGGELIHIYLRM